MASYSALRNVKTVLNYIQFNSQASKLKNDSFSKQVFVFGVYRARKAQFTTTIVVEYNPQSK